MHGDERTIWKFVIVIMCHTTLFLLLFCGCMPVGGGPARQAPGRGLTAGLRARQRGWFVTRQRAGGRRRQLRSRRRRYMYRRPTFCRVTGAAGCVKGNRRAQRLYRPLFSHYQTAFSKNIYRAKLGSIDSLYEFSFFL